MCVNCFNEKLHPFLEANYREGFFGLNDMNFIVQFLPGGEELGTAYRLLSLFSFPPELIDPFVEKYKTICRNKRVAHQVMVELDYKLSLPAMRADAEVWSENLTEEKRQAKQALKRSKHSVAAQRKLRAHELDYGKQQTERRSRGT